jgi:hypothetical protein
MPSDRHSFIGRIFDLSIVAYNFDSYAELSRFPDCKYAIDVNHALTGLTRRVESLNMVGDMLWPQHIPSDFGSFPVSRYEWLAIATDVFLIRYVSVVDCVLLLVNEVFELGHKRQDCTLRAIKKTVPTDIYKLLDALVAAQGQLRSERNQRVHHGSERDFTDDDTTFRLASRFERWANGMKGRDRLDRPVNVRRSFNEGLVSLQRDFNQVTRGSKRQLDEIYDTLRGEFEARFGPRIRAATHGLNAGARGKH